MGENHYKETAKKILEIVGKNNICSGYCGLSYWSCIWNPHGRRDGGFDSYWY